MITSRFEQIHALISTLKLDAILIASTSTIFYLTNYRGFSSEERECYVLITRSQQYLFTDSRYIEITTKMLPHFVIKEITGKISFPDLLEEIRKNQNLQKIGFEADILTVAEYTKINKIPAKFIPTDLSALRIKKDSGEIKAIQEACTIGDKAFQYMVRKIKPHIAEQELCREIELYAISQNATLSFPTIIAFGANASMPHYLSTDTKIKPNQFILCDLGIKMNGYCSDMTRTIFYGKPTVEHKKIYQIVLDAQKKAQEYIQEMLDKKHPLIAKKIDAVAREYIIQKGYPSIPHSLGHGTGIQVHETPWISPKSETQLTEGMVFSIEPGIYVPGNLGIRIEDLATIRNNHLILLTQSDRNLMVIE